jgi:hypothetical protein
MIPRTPKPAVTVVHCMPGRIRMRLSPPLADAQTLIDFLHEHSGMGATRYTPRTGSLLVCYQPHVISSEEITLRTAFRYAIDQGNRPVRLLASPEQVPLQNSAVISGVGVLTTLAMRWLDPASKNAATAEWLAGLGTAWSVLDHGWRELRSRGYFDPEVLALAYLAAALVRGNVLTASVVTWMATFGRHLVEMPATGVLVQPVTAESGNGAESRYEIVVGPDTDASDRLRLGLVGFLNSALRYAMTGGGAHGLRSFWEELRDVSRVHGEVLEGYSQQRGGIPIRFQQITR